MFCNKVRGIVNDLEKKHGDSMTFAQYPAGADESKKVLAANKLGKHGALARTGAGKVVWKAPGHAMDAAMVKKGVDAVLKAN